MKKFFVSMITAIICLMSVFSVGCGGVDNSESTLEIYAWNAGWGTKWVENTAETFKELSWVKEKYGEINIAYVFNDNNSFGADRIPAGSKNTVDLFFTESIQGLFGGKYITDLTELVYNKEVPGESVLFKDKMYTSYYNSVIHEDGKNYYVPWMGGAGGIVYNATLLKDLGFEVPNTTDELLAICEVVKNGKAKNQAALYSDKDGMKTYSLAGSKIDYMCSYAPTTWWAQYEGIDGYSDFYNAIDEDGIVGSIEVLYKQGRREVLDIMEKLYSPDYGYYNESSPNYEFMEGQTQLLMGNGIFMGNGNWFANEMREINQGFIQAGYDYEFGFMKTPIISAIVDKTPSIVSTAETLGKTADQLLSLIVAEIDAGATSSGYTGVIADDFDFIREARGIVYSLGANTFGVVPEYAVAKEVAIDYLRWLASDEALAIYMESTGGGAHVFKYDAKANLPDQYKNYDLISRNVIDIYNYDKLLVLPHISTFPMVRYGGWNAFAPDIGGFDVVFSTKKHTAQTYWDEVINYWTDNGNRKFNQAIELSGILN